MKRDFESVERLARYLHNTRRDIVHCSLSQVGCDTSRAPKGIEEAVFFGAIEGAWAVFTEAVLLAARGEGIPESIAQLNEPERDVAVRAYRSAVARAREAEENP